MSSLLQTGSGKNSETHESYVLSFEKTLEVMLKVQEVELVMKKLKFLGINYDPFSSEVSSECQQVMENLGLTDHMKNPYLATNILLRLLDKTEERLNQLQS